MNKQLAEILVFSATAYLLIGVLFAIAFASRGVQRIDPAAEGSGWGFRLMILPASTLLWPLLARRWWRGEGPPVERTAHRVAHGETIPAQPGAQSEQHL